MPRTLQKNVWLLKLLFAKEAFDQFVRVPPYEILVFPINFFSQQNEINLRGKKCTALFHTHNWEQSSFQRARTRIYTDIRIYVTGGMSWPLTCRRILSWILPRRDNTSPCRKHKLTLMENTTGTIKRLIVYRELLPFLPIWPELRFGIHFDISFIIFLNDFDDLLII